MVTDLANRVRALRKAAEDAVNAVQREFAELKLDPPVRVRYVGAAERDLPA